MDAWRLAVEKRSFRLGSDDVSRERKVFEGYGIHEDSCSDNYRKLLEILCENLSKGVLSPEPVYSTPDCKKFTEIQGKFYCVSGKKRSTVTYKKTHLSICDSCVKQGCNDSIKAPILDEPTPEPVLPEPVKVGEVPTDETEILQPHQTEQFVPVKGFEKTLFYARSDGGKFCPFKSGKEAVVYKWDCDRCKDFYFAKYQACLKLRAPAQISKHVDLRK
jgi:hypothetical protein